MLPFYLSSLDGTPQNPHNTPRGSLAARHDAHSQDPMLSENHLSIFVILLP